MDESKTNPGEVTPEATQGTDPADEGQQLEVPTVRLLAPITTPPVPRDEDAEQAARVQPPAQNEGSGQFAVWDADLGQYVSGVSDKSGANAAKKSLEDHNGAITDGHTLEVREV